MCILYCTTSLTDYNIYWCIGLLTLIVKEMLTFDIFCGLNTFFLLNIMKIIRKHYINVFVLNLPKKHRCFWLVRLYRQQSPIWYIFFLEFHFLISFWLTTLNLDVLQFHLKPMLGEGEGCFYIRVGPPE